LTIEVIIEDEENHEGEEEAGWLPERKCQIS
jgi:hypothetical protein